MVVFSTQSASCPGKLSLMCLVSLKEGVLKSVRTFSSYVGAGGERKEIKRIGFFPVSDLFIMFPGELLCRLLIKNSV